MSGSTTSPAGVELEHLTVAQLRDKMKEHGFDVPTSVGREFMIKKLKNIQQSSTAGGGGGARKVTKGSGTGTAGTITGKKERSPGVGQQLRSSRSTAATRGNVISAATSSSTSSRQVSAALLPPAPVGHNQGRTQSSSSGGSSRSHSSVDEFQDEESETRDQRRDVTFNERDNRRSSTRISSSSRGSGRNYEGDIIDGSLRSSLSAREPSSVSSRSGTRGRQSSPSVSRSMTRASSGRVVKPEPSWNSPSRSSRSGTRGKTEIGESVSLQNLEQISQFQQANFLPMMMAAAAAASTAAGVSNNGNQFNTSQSQSVAVGPVKSNMFGVIVPGRMVSTDFIANLPLRASKFQFELLEAQKVDYLVIFLTGNEPFPPGSGGEIFFGWANPMKGDGVDDWIKLGFITNEKPSVIFKISDLRNYFLQQAAAAGAGNPQQTFPFNKATLGIDLQPLESILKSISPQLEL